MPNKHGSFTYRGHGVNDQGDHWCSRDYGNGSNSYHYSNRDGSYYYQNPDGSRYYNNGLGRATYTAPNDMRFSSGYAQGDSQGCAADDSADRSHPSSYTPEGCPPRYGSNRPADIRAWDREANGQNQTDRCNEYCSSYEPTPLSSSPESSGENRDQAWDHIDEQASANDRDHYSSLYPELDSDDHKQASGEASEIQSSSYDYEDDSQADERYSHDNGYGDTGYDDGNYGDAGYDDGNYVDDDYDGGYDDDGYECDDYDD